MLNFFISLEELKTPDRPSRHGGGGGRRPAWDQPLPLVPRGPSPDQLVAALKAIPVLEQQQQQQQVAAGQPSDRAFKQVRGCGMNFIMGDW